MMRLPGWRARMTAFIDQVRRTPFAWGAFDCGPAFAGRHVALMTGEDVSARWRGRYDSAESALELIRDAGFTDLGALVGSVLEPCHPSQLRIGDLAGVVSGDAFGVGLGIVNGERVFVPAARGLGTVDLLGCATGWRVG